MAQIELFVALLAAVVLAALVGERLREVPAPVALVLGGLAAGLLPFAPEVELEPEVIFLAFLPAILYPAASRFATEDLRGNLRPIALLAIGLVLATTTAIAAVSHFVGGLPWGPAFVLGAVLAPTDPVAATAVIRKSGAPARLVTILEGESLINDGTALTCLRIAIGAVGASFSLPSGLLEFVAVAGGGAAVGAALGWATSRLRGHVDEAGTEMALAVLLAYGSFLLAELIHVSGILATVAAGWMMGRRAHLTMGAGARIAAESFWRVIQFVAQSILFLLVGLAFAQALDDTSSRPDWELAGLTLAVVATAVAVRFAWMFTVPHPSTRDGQPLVGGLERAVLGWTGLRGAVSAAAVLSIPVTVAGEPFPERGTITIVALGAIVVLLVLPALTLPAVLRATDLTGTQEGGERARRVRAELARAALAEIEQHDVVGISAEFRRRLCLRYERLAGDHGADHPAERRLQRAAYDAERRRLYELHDAGEVSGQLLRELERDLDLEEERES